MGKRIPKSRRHKKLKFVDPDYRGRQPCTKKKRLQFNEPPTNDDEQEIPHGMEEFMKLKNRVKEGKIKKRNKKKKAYKNDFIVVKDQVVDHNEPEMSTKIPKQSKIENEHQYINRLQRLADKALAEARVEEKYNIKLVKVDKEGNAVYKSLDEEHNETNRKQKQKKYREKLLEKKKLKVDEKEFEFKREHIPFGDVVEAPPILSTKHKTTSLALINKVGKKNRASKEQQDSKSDEAQSSVATKWKDLSADRRKELENERSRAVQMYRLLKNKRT